MAISFARVAQRQPGRICAQQLGQAAPFDQLHAEVMLTLVFADFVDRHDVRMIEVGRRLGLLAEPAHVVGRSELAAQDHLQRHRAFQALLASFVDHAHAAAGNLAEQFVVAEITDPVDDRRLAAGPPNHGRWSARRPHAIFPAASCSGRASSLHGVAIAEKRLQLFGQIRIARQHHAAVDRLPRLDRVQILGQRLLQALLAGVVE